MRQDGTTTRIIDEAVQTLFTKGEVTIIDHHRTRKADTYAYYRFLDRLSAEHFRGVRLADHLQLDGKRLHVKIKNK